MCQKLIRLLLLASTALLSLVSCGSDTRSIASRFPRFARDGVRKMERERHFTEDGLEVTTFIGATPRGRPFVAVASPKAMLNQRSGSHVKNAGPLKNTFSAYAVSSLYVCTQDYTVDLSALYRFPSLFSYKIAVEDDDTITIDPGLFKLVFQRQDGAWKNTAVRCEFPRQEVTEKELRAETAALEKNGWGDKTFPPGHGEHEERYRHMVLNYVAAGHARPSKVYASEETSTTSYLAGLLYELMEKGVPIVFEKQ